mmetsp:Transcript_5100/g.13428  ORF Transcript_5100/g.13428 Transcript_5100/m.13428 type:complete len:242 (-) Transcript_5100:2916-3641(-)
MRVATHVRSTNGARQSLSAALQPARLVHNALAWQSPLRTRLAQRSRGPCAHRLDMNPGMRLNLRPGVPPLADACPALRSCVLARERRESIPDFREVGGANGPEAAPVYPSSSSSLPSFKLERPPARPPPSGRPFPPACGTMLSLRPPNMRDVRPPPPRMLCFRSPPNMLCFLSPPNMLCFLSPREDRRPPAPGIIDMARPDRAVWPPPRLMIPPRDVFWPMPPRLVAWPPLGLLPAAGATL